MDDLIRWFGEQLDTDMARANAAPPGPWAIDGSGSIVDANGAKVIRSVGGAMDGRMSRWPEGPAAEHILGSDPSRVIHDIEADRALLQKYIQVAANDVNDVEYAHGWANALGEAVRLRALSYSLRPGYREAWRP